MTGTDQIDPAVVDRRSRYVGPVSVDRLPARDMTIAGITGKAGAVILSKDPKGPASRLVEIPAGWANVEPGAFTAGVELFVLDGELHLDGRLVGPHCLVRAEVGVQVETLRSDGGARALMFTTAPVRFDAGEFPGAPEVCCFRDLAWVDEGPGTLTKTAGGADTTSRLVMAGHAARTEWTDPAGFSERYVVAGQWREVDTAGDGAAGPVTMATGGYVGHPPGFAWDGSGAGTDTVAVLFERLAESRPV